MIRKLKIPKSDLSVRFLPETLDADKRTVEMVFTTAKPTLMWKFDGWNASQINEILSMDPSHIRMDRMKKGAPLLNSHNRWDLKAQIGVVLKAWTDGDQLKGVVQFSKRADVEPIFQDVKDGIIRNGSVGYKVHKYADESKEGDKVKTMRAVDWEPVEMSLVTIGADPDAQVRAAQDELHECEFETQNERTLDMPPTPEEIAAAKAAKETPAPTQTELDNVRQEEREKNSKILRSCRMAKLPDAFAETLIASGKSLLLCMEEIQTKWAEADARGKVIPAAGVTVDIGSGQDEVDTRREGAAEAILARGFPGEHKMTERAKPFMGRSAIEICRQICELNGVRTFGMSQDDIIKKAFHSTSDFTSILENVASKRLQKAYENVEQPFKKFAVPTTLKDFKQTSVAALGEMSALEKLKEGGEVKFGTMGDSKEVYALATYAKGIAVTRQTIINDDLAAFAKLTAAFGRAAAQLENKVALNDAFLANPAMGDTVVIFHSNHKNLGSAAAISETTVSALKALLRKQVDDKGNKLNLAGQFLLVGPDQEDAARKILATTTGNGGFNVHASAFELLVAAEITDNAHYLIADPAAIEGLEYAYLEGTQGVQLESMMHPETLGVIIRAHMDFAAKAINWRAFVKNAGA